jgi:RimJ/RimL family protein N-acetyltransferase
MDQLLVTDRLVVRAWSVDDAGAALPIYGAQAVTRWLTPAMSRVEDVAAMRDVLHKWRDEQPDLLTPQGRWAVLLRDSEELIGGVSIRLLPPYEDDLELSWQLRPDHWGHGYATEVGRAMVEWAFTQDAEELFAVARPNNQRAIATAERIGMRWVGETSKYYDLRLQVFRVRPNELG